MRIPPLVLVFLAILCAGLSSPCLAQRTQAIGVSLHSTHPPTNQITTHLASQRAVSDGQSSIGTWIVLGALAGAVAAGIWAGVQVSHSDDPMLANAAIAYVVGAGAIIGGVTGAFGYIVSHSESQGQ